VTLLLTRHVPIVVGLAGCDELATDRVWVTVLPLPVSDVAEAPCTVVAEVVAHPDRTTTI
jgi:kynurenine formamidase